MFKTSVFFLVCSVAYLAGSEESFNSQHLEGEPHANISNCVNSVTGKFHISQIDLQIAGREPILIPRFYSEAKYESSITIFPHTKLKETFNTKKGKFRIEVTEPNGTMLHYRAKNCDRTRCRLSSKLNDFCGFTNTSKGSLSGQTNIRNRYLSYNSASKVYTLHRGDGRRFHYIRSKVYGKKIIHPTKIYQYVLDYEKLPNGNRRCFRYDSKDRITKIFTTDPTGKHTYATASFSYDAEKRSPKRINGSDGQYIEYQYDDNTNHLTKIRWSSGKIEKINISGLIKSLSFNGKGELEVSRYSNDTEEVGHQKIKLKNHYDSRRNCVKSLQAPAGENGTKIDTHLFFYHLDNGGGKSFNEHGRGFTDVYDAENNCVRYIYDDTGRHTGTSYYSKSTGLIYKENFFWKRNGDLKKKVYKDRNNNHYLSFAFEYDKNHNCTKETLTGDLIGNGNLENYPIYYKYSTDGFSLVKKISEGDNSTTISYLKNTNLPIEKLHYCKDKIYKREFFHYDKHNLLLKEIVDDGSSEDENDMQSISMRLITLYAYSNAPHSLHLVESISKIHWNALTNSEALDSKTKYYYNARCKIVREEQFDKRSQLYRVSHYEYDQRGNLIKKINPINEMAITEYDRWNNPIKIVAPNGLTTKIHYDQCFRETYREEYTKNDSIRVHNILYDLKSQVKKITGPGGKVTKTDYDLLGNLLSKKTYVNGKWIEAKSTYNPAGKPLIHIDGNGNKTTITYTCRGKPTKITYSDGTSASKTYNLDGTVAKQIDRSGKYTLFEYDHQKRPTRKILFAKDGTHLDEEIATYNTFHLLTQRAKGVQTLHKYNYAGQEIEEKMITKEGSITTTFHYDEMGRIEKKTFCAENCPPQVTTYTYDKLDRITSETKLSANGVIQTQASYTYDTAGNKKSISTLTSQGESIETFIYDSFNRLIERSDREGRKTTTQYLEEPSLKVQTKEPNGRIILETYDTLERMVKHEVLFKDQLIQAESFSYDNNGNKLAQKSLLDNREKASKWSYDSNNKPLSITQSSTDTPPRITSFSYTKDLQLEKVLKPDGNTIYYSYNNKGLEQAVRDELGTVDYSLVYDELNRLVTVIDHINKNKTLRKFSTQGYLLKEQLANHLKLTNTYRLNGQKTKCQLPDSSSIEYTYDTYNLKKITRKTPQGEELYNHEYQKHDKGGAPLAEQVIFDLGRIDHTYKLSGREVKRATPFTQEHHSEFDPNGNLLAKSLTVNDSTYHNSYAYDPLDQITQEDGYHHHSYTYDSHYNRESKDQNSYEVDGLNQVLATTCTEITYDDCGRPTFDSKKGLHLFYDGLDRLIRIETPHTAIDYTYDYWNRRLTKKTPQKIHQYLYDGENEVGRITNGIIDQLRILGIGQGAEIGAAIAIELDERAYLPIHSISGNIIALIDPITKTPVSQIIYSAFGEQYTQGTTLSPWRFQSKRYDIDLDLTFFGNRYYDATLGRFITPDPKGLPTIPNPYPFVLNNPFSAFDLYGLEPLFDNEFDWSQPNNIEKSNKLYEKPETGEDIIVKFFEQELADKEKYQVKKDHYSKTFQLGLKDLPNYRHNLHVNGIDTSKDKFFSNMYYLSDISGGYNVYGVHNATHGKANDTLEALMQLHGTATEPVLLLRDLMATVLASNSEATAKLFAHSQGAIISSLALRLTDKSLRERISVVAIAPAKYIPNELCKNAINYISRDFVPKLQNYVGKRDNRYTDFTIERLKPHKWNILMDHDFQSPTYFEPIKKHLTDAR